MSNSRVALGLVLSVYCGEGLFGSLLGFVSFAVSEMILMYVCRYVIQLFQRSNMQPKNKRTRKEPTFKSSNLHSVIFDA